MKKSVLWLDNDPAYLTPYVAALIERGYDTQVVTKVLEAEKLVQENRYDLLILDVMIPTKDTSEEVAYPPEATDYGLRTGLIFYRRMRERLRAAKIPVLVMTVRLDSSILEEFKKSGLSQDFFYTKMTLREVPVFIKKIEDIMDAAAPH